MKPIDADMMQFPETWEEFEEQYGFIDTEQVYTNGARLIPSFRVEQWLENKTNRITGKERNKMEIFGIFSSKYDRLIATTTEESTAQFMCDNHNKKIKYHIFLKDTWYYKKINNKEK